MKAEYGKILRRSAFLVGMLAVCAVGFRTAVARTEANAPDAMTAAAQQNPVLVLDAGHSESTETESRITGSSPRRGASVFGNEKADASV